MAGGPARSALTSLPRSWTRQARWAGRFFAVDAQMTG